jgi:hypothetical protein
MASAFYCVCNKARLAHKIMTTLHWIFIVPLSYYGGPSCLGWRVSRVHIALLALQFQSGAFGPHSFFCPDFLPKAASGMMFAFRIVLPNHSTCLFYFQS